MLFRVGQLRRGFRVVAASWAFSTTIGCSAQAVIIPNPPEANVVVDGKKAAGNVLQYGRWIGNSYEIEVSAPKFKSYRTSVRPTLGDRAGGLAFACVATVVGIPLLPVVFWNGELDERIYVSLQPIDR